MINTNCRSENWNKIRTILVFTQVKLKFNVWYQTRVVKKISPLHWRSQDLQRGGRFCRGGVVLSKIPDFHGQFKKKKILVSGISRSISKIFFQRGSFAPPDPPAYAYALCLVPNVRIWKLTCIQKAVTVFISMYISCLCFCNLLFNLMSMNEIKYF
jgi:hypothetical protein